LNVSVILPNQLKIIVRLQPLLPERRTEQNFLFRKGTEQLNFFLPL